MAFHQSSESLEPQSLMCIHGFFTFMPINDPIVLFCFLQDLITFRRSLNEIIIELAVIEEREQVCHILQMAMSIFTAEGRV